MASSAGNGVSSGFNGGARTPFQPAKGPMPHMDDLKGYPKDVDANQSIKRLLETAEISLRQAEFGRLLNPPTAFKDYIRAYVIAVDYIPAHREYPFLKDSQGALCQAHQAFLRKLKDQQLAFDAIKRDIIDDNKRTGVQPRRTSVSAQGNGSSTRSSGESQQWASPRTSSQSARGTESPRVKPSVHPKPQALRANALPSHTRGGSISTGQQDLLARFNNLRMPPSGPGQDPRIKTHPMPTLKPSGPRDMPSPSVPKIGIPDPAVGLPKMPDAIYSPVRTNATGDMGGAPSSSSRGLYSRTPSSSSISSSRTSYQQFPNGDYPSSAPSSHRDSGSSEQSPAVRRLAEQDTILAEDLYDAMKDRSCSILLIDIRTRREYNEGHIMSSSIICIEPDLLSREAPSAHDLAESMAVYADQEHTLFEKRDKYDLVIFYDQRSSSLPKTAHVAEDVLIISLHRALVLLNYGKELKYSPKLLSGGLDSWIDLMGPSSLQSTSSSGAASRRGTLDARSSVQRRLSKYSAKPLKPTEVEAWKETIQNEDLQTYHRSEQDFLRRFPSVSRMQESMTSPLAAMHHSGYGSSHKNDLHSELPTPPSRPAPSVPRPSLSGFSSVDHDHGIQQGPSGQDQQVSGPFAKAANGSVQVEKKHYTGPNNPGNWCYANSALQSLFASDEFGREFIESTWKSSWRVPRKPGERIDPPQLLTRIMSSLFHWMNTGDFDMMKAKTLMV